MNLNVLPHPRRALSLAGLALGLITAPQALALSSTSDLKQACESAPDRIVYIETAVKISNGVSPPSTQKISGKCTLVLGPSGSFETDDISVSFSGAFAVQSSYKTKVVYVDSQIVATGQTYSLSANGSEVIANRSQMKASTQHLKFQMGNEGKVEIVESLGSDPYALLAAKTVLISGPSKLATTLTNAEAYAPLGFKVNMTGSEGVLLMSNFDVQAFEGAVNLLASGSKTLTEIGNSDFWYATAGIVRLSGAESVLKLDRVSFNPGYSDTLAPGNVVLEAGKGSSAAQGKVEAVEVTVVDAAQVSVLASSSAQKGEVSVQKSSFSSTGNVSIKSGETGATTVQDNTLGSATKIIIASGAGGSCKQESNSLSAPSLSLCK